MIPRSLYLVLYVDDGIPFLKVGIGVRRLDRPGARRLTNTLPRAPRSPRSSVQLVGSPACGGLVLEAFRPGYAYQPRRPGAGPYLQGAETLLDAAPVKLSRLFPLI